MSGQPDGATAAERVARVRAEAEAVIAAARMAALDDTRIRYLGRKAKLPNLLRQVAQLPTAQRSGL
jgi:phenylalanyl-tRNA synthetase alpha chain